MSAPSVKPMTVLVTGGAGYVGSLLVPRLLTRGHAVRVVDLCWYGADALAAVHDAPRFQLLACDIRDGEAMRRALMGVDAVVHLAAISNDPSFELDPLLGRSINLGAFEPLVRYSVDAGVRRFVYASSSSVYGVSEARDVTEDHPLSPLTDYSRYKAECEGILLEHLTSGFCPVIVRPATLCGHAPRQRLDLTVNILTNLAVNRGEITVFGGSQKRPNLHVADMVDLYERLLTAPSERVAGRTFNAGYENHTVAELAQKVADVVRARLPERSVRIVTSSSDDLRSYHISSERIRRELGFVPGRSISDAVADLCAAFSEGKLPDSLSDPRYFNVRRMQELTNTEAAS